MQNSLEIVQAIHRNRYAVLLFFRHAFIHEPDRRLADIMQDGSTSEAFAAFATEENGLSHAADFLKKTVEHAADAGFLDDIYGEYMRMFVGPGKIIAPFWESVYRDPREILFTETTADVRRRYQAEGYRLDAESREAEDSIALQMDFLANLTQRTLQALETGDCAEYERLVNVQHDFECDHMTYWVPLFAERARNSRTKVLYPQLCEYAADFVAFDVQLLEDLAKEGVAS